MLEKGVVQATDEDTSSELKFSIDWDQTSFTKNGRNVETSCDKK